MLTVRVYQEPMTAMVLDTALAIPIHLHGTHARADWIEEFLRTVYGVGHEDTTRRVVDGCDQLAGLLVHGNPRERTIDNVTSKQVAHTFGPAATDRTGDRVGDWSIDEP